jgi:polar amino acid transport system permease protein
MNPIAAGIFQVPWATYVPELWHALLMTLAYTVVSFVGATILGLVVALMRLADLRALRAIAAVYTELFKNVPLLAIIFVTYFGLTSVSVQLNVFQAGSLSLILFYAAYLS